MRRSRRCAAPAMPRAARRFTSRWSLARITANRRPAPTRSSPRALRASSRRSRTPIPKVAGEGHARLRAAGIAVEVGVGAGRGAPRPCRPHPAHARRPTARHAQARDLGRRQSRRRRPPAGRDHRRGGARPRPSAAGAERRDHGRHRHGARRRSDADLPAAGHGGVFAGAHRARQRAAPAVGSRLVRSARARCRCG